METIGLFWGSNTGNQEEASGFLKDYMVSEGFNIDEYNIVDTKPEKMLEYKILIIGYPEIFLDAIGLLAKPFIEKGGDLVGRWPTEGYEFDNSLALDGDEFLGLGLDNDNEEELTEERLIIGAELIRDEFDN